MASLRDIRDEFEAILAKQKEFISEAEEVRTSIIMMRSALDLQAEEAMSSEIANLMEDWSGDVEILRRIDSVLGTELEYALLRHEKDLAELESVMLSTPATAKSSEAVDFELNELEGSRMRLRALNEKDAEMLRPVKELSDELEVRGIKRLDDKRGNDHWREHKNKFFFFGTLKRKAAKAFRAFESENDKSPYQAVLDLDEDEQSSKNLDSRIDNLRETRAYAVAKEAHQAKKSKNMGAVLQTMAVAVEARTKSVSSIESLTGADLSSTRVDIATSRALRKLEETVLGLLQEARKTSDTIENNLRKVKRGIRNRSRKSVSIDLQEISENIAKQRAALREPLSKIEAASKQGYAMRTSGHMPELIRHTSGNISAMETAIWVMLFSDLGGDFDVKSIDLNEVGIPAGNEIGSIEVGAMDVPGMEIPSIPTIDTSSFDSVSIDVGSSISSSSFGGSDFGGGF